MLAYLFPEGKITISGSGELKTTGVLAQYHSRIAPFIRELNLRGLTIRYRARRFYFPGSIDPGLQQRLRNFFATECPATR